MPRVTELNRRDGSGLQSRAGRLSESVLVTPTFCCFEVILKSLQMAEPLKTRVLLVEDLETSIAHSII